MGEYYKPMGDCMKGSIQTDLCCPVCGLRLKSLEPRGLHCEAHPQTIHEGRCRVLFDNVCTRFRTYREAYKVLTRKRSEVDAGTYDARDYRIKTKPLAFSHLANEWLKIKSRSLRPKSHQPIRNAMERAARAWGEANIKSIGYAEIEDLIVNLALAPKTKKNTLDALKQFWAWAAVRYNIPKLPAWPAIGHVEMRFRKTISLADQERILAKIKERVGTIRPRAWLAIKWLTLYISVRPGEMISLIEGQMDRQRGLLIFPHPKERRPKVEQLLDDDLELLRSFPEEHPSMPFFRHDVGRYAGRQFGPQLLWMDWKKACRALGIEGVDLYGGTKHSTAMGLRDVATFEEIRKMTGHTTNKAFDRYLQLEGEKMKELRSRRQKLIAAPDNGLTMDFGPVKEQNIKTFQ